MRYTIIHHDVREYFDLTPIQYMVVDSIHQLSHGAPTKKPNTKISEFLGIDEGSVRNAVKIGIEKGVLSQSNEGLTTTEKWSHVVTYLPIRKNSEEIRKNSESYNIYIKNTNSETKVSHSVNNSITSEGYTTVPVTEDGDPIPTRKKPTAKFPNAGEVFTLFRSVTGIYDPLWIKNTTQKSAAQELYEARGVEKIKNALEFWMANRDNQYIPYVGTPNSLKEKYLSLLEFRRKNNL